VGHVHVVLNEREVLSFLDQHLDGVHEGGPPGRGEGGLIFPSGDRDKSRRPGKSRGTGRRSIARKLFLGLVERLQLLEAEATGDDLIERLGMRVSPGVMRVIHGISPCQGDERLNPAPRDSALGRERPGSAGAPSERSHTCGARPTNETVDSRPPSGWRQEGGPPAACHCLCSERGA
jgi:hypothetical protein